MITLETERLLLRDWQHADLDGFSSLMINPNVTLPEGSQPLQNRDACLALLQYLIDARNNYAVVLRETGEAIGSIGLNEDALGQADVRNLGFMLAEAYWDRGLMTEALRAVLAHAAASGMTLSCVHAPENTKSAHIIHKLGFVYVEDVHGFLYYTQGVRDDSRA